MAEYTPTNPLNVRDLLVTLVNPRYRLAVRCDRTVVKLAVNNGRKKTVRPTSYVEYELQRDVTLLAENGVEDEALELVVPTGAKLTVWTKPDTWKLSSILEDKAKDTKSGKRIIKAARTTEPRVATFEYTRSERDWTLTVLMDATLRLGSVREAKRHAM